MPSAGRKFLMAGRGGLNLTHSEPLPTLLDRYGPEAGPVRRAVEAFPPYAEYQTKTQRQIPVLLVEPVDAQP